MKLEVMAEYVGERKHEVERKRDLPEVNASRDHFQTNGFAAGHKLSSDAEKKIWQQQNEKLSIDNEYEPLLSSVG